MDKSKPAVCTAIGCEREIVPKWQLCRPCAVADTRGHHSFLEACGAFQHEPSWPLTKTCYLCGWDSALHPGRGIARLDRVRIPGRLGDEEGVAA